MFTVSASEVWVSDESFTTFSVQQIGMSVYSGMAYKHKKVCFEQWMTWFLNIVGLGTILKKRVSLFSGKYGK